MVDLNLFVVLFTVIGLLVMGVVSVIKRLLNRAQSTPSAVNAEIIPFPTKIKADRVETDKTPFNTKQKASSWIICLLIGPFGLILPIVFYYHNRSNDKQNTQLAILKALNNN